MRIRELLLVGLVLLVTGCGIDIAQQAKTITVTYTASANVAKPILKSDMLPPATEACVKAADEIAFNYVEQLNLTAQEWIDAGEKEKTPLENAFVQVKALTTSAMTKLSDALAGKGVC